MKSSPDADTQGNDAGEAILLSDALERVECEQSYYDFFRRAWRELEPETDLLDNWHIKFICDRLQLEVERIVSKKKKTRDLIVCIPPRSGKSYLVSVMLCPWAWTRYPHLKFINSSYSVGLSMKHCVDGRRLIEGPWYQRHWVRVFAMTGDQNVKSHFENDQHGVRLATSVTGSITGHGGDVIIADDLMDPRQAGSEAHRTTAIEHYEKTLFTRLNDQDVGLRVVVMQRVNDMDLVGHLVSTKPDSYDKYIIPAELEKDVIEPKEIAKNYSGGLFFPKRFSREVLSQVRTGMSNIEYECQYQQNPVPITGNIIKAEWLLEGFSNEYAATFMAIDCAISKKDHASETAATVVKVGFERPPVFTETVTIHGRWGFYEQINHVVELNKAESPELIGIEGEKGGMILFEVLQKMGLPVILLPPDTDKVRRLMSVSHLFSQRRVRINTPKMRHQLLKFTGEEGEKNDLVDAIAHCIRMILGHSPDMYEKKIDPLAGLDARSKLFWESHRKEKEGRKENVSDFFKGML